MFPYSSLNSAHPRPPTLGPQVCSLCLCLHCCPANRFISTMLLSSVQFSSVSQSCPTLCWTAKELHPVHHQLLEFTQTHAHWIGDAIQPSHPLSSPLLPSIFPSIRVFYNESALCIRWPKYWSFGFSISSSGLISFRIEWLDLLAVQGTLRSLFQHQSSKVSILRCSVFFMVQLSHTCVTTGKAIALTIWTFVDKVMPTKFAF